MQFLRSLFTGRINRIGYIMGALYSLVFCLGVYFLISIIYVMIVLTISKHTNQYVVEDPVVVLTIVMYAAIILASVSLAARRLNDVDRPTWFCIFSLIPFVNLPLGVYLLIAPGTNGPNTYGKPSNDHSFATLTRVKLFRRKDAAKSKR